MVNKVSIRRRTKKYKIKKRKKKTKKKGKKRKMKGGGLADKFLGFFNTAPKKEPQNLENGKIVNGKIENGKIVNDQDKKNCPQQKGVFETINDFSKEQVNTLKNSLNDANAKIKKTATDHVGRTFSNIMDRMVEKSEKENVCPCCKRPYTDKEKVPAPKAGYEAPKAGYEAPKAGYEAPKAGDEANADIMKKLAENPKAKDEEPKAGDEAETAKDLSDERQQ